jgi:hypothetical protein
VNQLVQEVTVLGATSRRTAAIDLGRDFDEELASGAAPDSRSIVPPQDTPQPRGDTSPSESAWPQRLTDDFGDTSISDDSGNEPEIEPTMESVCAELQRLRERLRIGWGRESLDESTLVEGGPGSGPRFGDKHPHKGHGEVTPEQRVNASQLHLPDVSHVDVSKVHCNGCETAIHQLFGADATPAHVAALAGAPNDATVTISRHHGSSLRVKFEIPGLVLGDRTFEKTAKGITCRTEDINVAEEHRDTGIAKRIQRTFIENLKNAGVLSATGNAKKDLPHYNGWMIWPKMGYDAKLEKWVHQKMKAIPTPPHVANAKTIQDLYSTPEGIHWWEQHGNSHEMSIDLQDASSVSHQKAMAYLEKIKAEMAAKAKDQSERLKESRDVWTPIVWTDGWGEDDIRQLEEFQREWWETLRREKANDSQVGPG